MKPFEYLAPGSLKEALEMLNSYGGDAVVMAGGTDVIPLLSERAISPRYVIHLDKLNELRYIKEEQGCIKIGPLVTVNELLASDLIKNKLSALWQAADASAAPQVRNLGTIGGNLGTASPAGDLNIALAALNAKVVAGNKTKTSEYAVEDFLTGTKKNVLSNNQIITEIVVPVLPANTKSSFRKIGTRKAMTISVANVAAVVTVDSTGKKIQNARVVFGSVAPVPVVSKKYAGALAGTAFDSEAIRRLSSLVKEEISPITDMRATAEYRSEIAGVLAVRCVEDCLGCVQQGEVVS